MYILFQYKASFYLYLTSNKKKLKKVKNLD